MSSANQEQVLAIEHNGGVQLQAGAGSGKTFVLIEHLIYLIDRFIQDNPPHDLDQFAVAIRRYLSKIVLMTFTKKAAGELAIRLNDKIASKIKNELPGSSGYQMWFVISEAINSMTVSTIDGFCYKLLSDGHFPHISPAIQIIQDVEAKSKIELLVSAWIDQHFDEVDPAMQEMFLAGRDKIITNIYHLFSDPDLRVLWSTLKDNDLEQMDFVQTMHELLRISGHLDVYSADIAYEPTSKKKASWQVFLDDNLRLINLPQTEIEWREHLQFMINLSIPQKPRDVSLVEVRDFFEKLRNLTKFYKENQESLLKYLDGKDLELKHWLATIKLIVDFVEKEYLSVEGMTFGDLEFYVLQGLRDRQIASNIAAQYRYFIVDEFQDTSIVQFDIIQCLIENDFNRLFTVGDLKQAIYGFKGGEIKVFIDCMKKTPTKLELANNYRSLPSVIQFNNHLFSYLFKLGINFDGNDIDPVEVTFQTIPSEVEYSSKGQIEKILVSLVANDISDEASDVEEDSEGGEQEKIKIDKLEAQYLFEKIKYLIRENPNDNVVVLYRKLTPASYLIDLLMEGNISFTSQIKIALAQDPLIILFKTLIEQTLNPSGKSSEKAAYLELIYQSVFELVGFKLEDTLSDYIERFYWQRKYYGNYLAFEMLCSNLGLANSNRLNNLGKIRSFCQLASDDETLYLLLKQASGDRYSIDFQKGNRASQVVIMTAHASKGLQFDHVLLGGIHTNGRELPDSPLFGKIPGSLLWYDRIETKKPLKTPMYLLEKKFLEHKNFAESKRLFYVACTRAKKSITWIDFDYGELKEKTNSKSWINGLRLFESDYYPKHKLDFEIETKTIEHLIEKKSQNKLNYPLFHIDRVGLELKAKSGSQVMIMPELSVTRLAHISNCSRKFYLANHLKLTEADLINLGLKSERQPKFELNQKLSEIVVEQKESFIDQNSNQVNSATRGSEVHANIEWMIKNNLVIPLGELNQQEKQLYQWVKDLLLKYAPTELMSEHSFKFNFFGQMISGIADLVLKTDDHNYQVWDFKTGKPFGSSERAYWFQLKCYAFALYELFKLPLDKKIKVALVYVDTRQFFEVDLNYQELRTELLHSWENSQKPYVKNLKHCPDCLYQSICDFQS